MRGGEAVLDTALGLKGSGVVVKTKPGIIMIPQTSDRLCLILLYFYAQLWRGFVAQVLDCQLVAGQEQLKDTYLFL